MTEVTGWHQMRGYGGIWTESFHGNFEYTILFVDGHAQNQMILRGQSSTPDFSADRN